MTLPTFAVPRRIAQDSHLLEDADEAGWFYVSSVRHGTKNGILVKIETAVRKLRNIAQFERCYVQIRIRGGAGGTIQVFADDPSDQPTVEYDLRDVIRVTKSSLPPAEALAFVTSSLESGEEQTLVHGQIALNIDAGSQGVLRIAFPSTVIRDAWAAWFDELIVQRELNDIDSSAAVTEGASGRYADIAALRSSAEGKQALRDFTGRFVRTHGGPDEASKRKPHALMVMPPGAKKYVRCLVSPSISSASLRFTVRNSSGFFSLSRVPECLTLGASVTIVSAWPWKPEFVVYAPDKVVWQFACSSVEERDTWIQLFRTVKGRGVLSQTENETYPFLDRAAVDAGDDDSRRAGTSFMVGTSSKSIPSSAFTVSPDEDDEHEEEDGEAAATPTVPPDVATVVPNDESDTADAWTEIEDRDSVYSGDSAGPHSVRAFVPFQAHLERVVLSYVDQTCIPHLLGRRNFKKIASNHHARSPMNQENPRIKKTSVNKRQVSPRATASLARAGSALHGARPSSSDVTSRSMTLGLTRLSRAVRTRSPKAGHATLDKTSTPHQQQQGLFSSPAPYIFLAAARRPSPVSSTTTVKRPNSLLRCTS